MKAARIIFLSSIFLSIIIGPCHFSKAQGNPPFTLDVPYVPTPKMIVDEMLKMAQVDGNDLLYDLGSGDGRIPITAAQRFGTRGVGIDLNPERIQEAKENAKKAKVTDKVTFIEGDIFDVDFSEATVITLYLFPEVNKKLRPKILRMEPGTRVVSHNYDMGDWKPEQSKKIKAPTAPSIQFICGAFPPIIRQKNKISHSITNPSIKFKLFKRKKDENA